MKHQETEDAELLALASYVAHEAAVIAAHTAQYGQLMSVPDYAAAIRLRELLVERGVLKEA